jgi:hypothetical protein
MLKAVAAAIAVVVVVALGFVVVRALTDGEETVGDLEVSVRAEVVEAGASGAVEATAIRRQNQVLVHGVRVTWRGQEAVRLDDARFTHHVQGERGDLVTAGRGCGADWDAQAGRVTHICTADLRIVDLRPGGSYEYPIRVHPEVGPLRLAPGTYVVDEVIRW